MDQKTQALGSERPVPTVGGPTHRQSKERGCSCIGEQASWKAVWRASIVEGGVNGNRSAETWRRGCPEKALSHGWGRPRERKAPSARGADGGRSRAAASHTSLRSLRKRDETLQVDCKRPSQRRMEDGGRESSPWQEGPHTLER